MKRSGTTRVLHLVTLAVTLCGGLLPCASAEATLGRNASSVAADGRALGALSQAPVSHARFTTHELRRNGLTVREYEDQAGVIFALSWRGVNHPDLAPLLGDYLSDYNAARKRGSGEHGHDRRRVVQGASVVVIKSGQLPSVSGSAFVPSLLPKGVTPHDFD